MSKKKDIHSVRPDPPSFTEITEDILSAAEDDVVFMDEDDAEQPSTLLDGKAAAQSLTSSENSSSGTLASEANVEEVCRKAVEFIQLTEQIRNGPDRLHSLHTRLIDACAELRSSIDCLQSQAKELKELADLESSLH